MSDLFIQPLLAGWLMSIILAFAGAGWFLRGFVWQALAVSQWAAVGGVAASIVAMPTVVAALLLAGGSMWLLSRLRQGNSGALLLFLLGLAVVTLLAANFPQASLAASNWAEGQIYFVASTELWAVIILSIISLLAAPALFRLWRGEQIFPDVALTPPPFWWRYALQALWLVMVVVLGSLVLGVPAALALLLIPAWVAAVLAGNLKQYLIVAQLIAQVAFIVAWWTALWADQPFAPVLILALTLVSGFALGAFRLQMARVHKKTRR